jgi:hypothetical protein
VAHWTAARAGATASLWPAVPRRMNRYLDELLIAHSHSLGRKTY